MRFIITIIVCCIVLFAKAQDGPISFSALQTYGGQNLLKNTNLHAVRYDVGGYRILNYARSNDNKKIYLFLREANGNGYYKKGDYIVYFDVIEGKISSQVKLHGYGKGYKMYERYITRDNGEVRDVYDPYTGKRMWYTNGYIAYVDTQKNLCITQDGVCFDMLTGKKKWSHKIGIKYDWASNLYKPEENTLMTIADGLQCIDVNTGEGWSYPLYMLEDTRSSPEFGHSIRTVMTTMMFGAIVAMALNASEHDTVFKSKLCSNIVQQDDKYYLAGFEEIICVNKTGKALWQKDLPYKTAISEIVLRGDTLLLISAGMKRKAVPYVAAYNSKTGDLLYKTVLVGQDNIIDYAFYDTTLFLRMETSAALYNWCTGEQIVFSTIDKNEKLGANEFKTIMDGENFFIHDSLNNKDRTLSKAFPGSYFLSNKKGDLLRLDVTLHVIGEVPQTQYGNERYFDTGWILTIMPGDKVFLKNEHEPVAQLESVPQLKCGNKLINIEPKGITVIDMPLASP